MISISYKNKGTGAEFTSSSFPENHSGPKKEVIIATEQGDAKILISGDRDIQSSAKIFKKVTSFLVEILDPIYNSFADRFKAQIHTFRNIQAQMKQKIEGLLGNDMLSLHRKSHKEKIEYTLSVIKEAPEVACETILFLQKRIIELEAHTLSFEIIHMGENVPLEIKSHNFPRVIHNIFSAFEESFDQIGVTFRFAFGSDTGENFNINFDYKIVNTALYNIFDNAYKYIMPYGEIRFFIARDKFIITMKSLRIEKEEKERIFELGFRGKNALHTEGSGIGMYVVNKALKLNGMSIKLEPDYSDVETYDNRQYVLNKFIIDFGPASFDKKDI